MTSLPVLPLRDLVIFPYMVVPLFVGRDRSVRALEQAMENDKKILLLAQKSAHDDDPTPEDIYEVGTVAKILQLLKLPDQTVKVLVEGEARARVESFISSDLLYEAQVEILPEEDLSREDDKDLTALKRTVLGQFEEYLKLNKKIPPEVLVNVKQIDDPSKLVDNFAAHLAVKASDKQSLLEMTSVAQRFERVLGFMEGEMGVLKIEKKIRGRVKRQMEKTQREYYLNEQMKAIQKELGEGEDGRNELSELEDAIAATKLPKDALDKAEGELKKLKSMSPMSAEASVVRNYLEWLTNIPWSKRSKIKKDLNKAEGVLNADHFGLEKVKERILEYLAVQNRMRKLKGPILCLVGPPGVGKTSLGKSIARATGRNFVRMSLGGVRDESEIRGHRRTYIGSMPGRIVQGMKKAKTSNPLFLLDEIDKLGADWRGDPSSALLEVLDPEQNSSFNDHYLEVDYDLSDVMFVTTANSLNMPQPLLDRMEIIRIGGYTEDEKVEISKRHLIPKQIKENGLKTGEVSIEDSAILGLVRYYTREAGVRNLEREISRLCRKAVRRLDTSTEKSLLIDQDSLSDYLGARRFNFGLSEEEDQIGVVTGLAWTPVGGELLNIEAVTAPGRGRIVTTGQLGDVMKESIQAAESFVKSRAVEFGIKPTLFHKKDMHVHVPEGATPKDGPSAGIGMVTSIVSVLSGIPVRKDVAMTGEVTLRGNVLEIGGLKEKLLAALRGGIKTALIPEDNRKDIEELPDNVKSQLNIIPVKTVDDVLAHALTEKPVPIEFDEEELDAILHGHGSLARSEVTKH